MKKTVEYYLAQGFDHKMAEYFAAGRKKIMKVMPNSDYTLTITFDNGERRLLDMKSTIKEGTVFAFLRDINNFNRVYVDSTHCIAWDIDPTIDSEVVWNNKVDLCPDTCYVDSVPLDEVTSA